MILLGLCRIFLFGGNTFEIYGDDGELCQQITLKWLFLHDSGKKVLLHLNNFSVSLRYIYIYLKIYLTFLYLSIYGVKPSKSETQLCILENRWEGEEIFLNGQQIFFKAPR